MRILRLLLVLVMTAAANATEFHVVPTGDDTHPGTNAKPLKTIQAAADKAQPGDVITVHEGIYRERVDPPRGGTSDANRITYQAAPGEKVIITGAEPIKGWEKVAHDTWKVTLPNTFFGDPHPFSQKVVGEWCVPTGRSTGAVYLNGEWFAESLTLDPVLKPSGKAPLWHARVGGSMDGGTTPYLFAIKSLSFQGKDIPVESFSAKKTYCEIRAKPCDDGEGQCLGWIRREDWVSYKKVDLSQGGTMKVVAGALGEGGVIEFYNDIGTPESEKLGEVVIPGTGGWEKWKTISVNLAPCTFTGPRTLYLVMRPGNTRRIPGKDTTLWAQFPGIQPNEEKVEIHVRQSVFYPSKTGINYITVRGFELRQAATPWGGAMSEQVGLIGTHWSKGWIIENNHIHHSMCKGIALGRYELPAHELPHATGEGFIKSIELALRDGWSKENIGGHIVRNNRIHDCEKNGIHGSLGANHCQIYGNEIHDIARTGWVQGADTGAMKFLGGVDLIIRDNHIYRSSGAAGIWLDWMAQGAQVTGNLLHHNGSDLFFEVNHGPQLAANNILLSGRAFFNASKGTAFVHNLSGGVAGGPSRWVSRITPFMHPNSTTTAGLHDNRWGDDRVINNLLFRCSLAYYDGVHFPSTLEGNVYLTGATPPARETAAYRKPNFDPGLKLTQKDDGWYLEIAGDPRWAEERTRKLVTTERLGKAVVPKQGFTHPDGSPITIDTDYFGNKRNPDNPFPGPFEINEPGTQTLKVWPKL